MRRAINTAGKIWKRCWIILCLSFCFNYYAVGLDGSFSWEFSDCELKDILFAVSTDTGISIVPDDTVSGKGDWKFMGSDFDSAFAAFLNCNRLFVERNDDFWVVSRFSFRRDGDLYFVDACDLTPGQILEKLSLYIDTVLTYESLPVTKISVHFNGVGEAQLLSGLGKRFGNYQVSRVDGSYCFTKVVENKKVEISDGFVRVEMNEEGISVDVREGKFSEIVERLFSLENQREEHGSFCILSGGDSKVVRSVFVGKDFTDTLTKVCSQGGCSYLCDGGIYYIFANGNKKNDLVTGERNWRKYTLRYTKSQEIFTFISKRIGKLEFLSLPDEYEFLCCGTTEEDLIIHELIETIDKVQKLWTVELKYQKPAELINNLPSFIDKNNISVGDEESVLYFRGSEDAYSCFLQQVELFDRPVKSISYDLLILQYDESKENNWSSSISFDKLHAGDRNSIAGVLGSVMGLNLNVVTAFGLSFAADLQYSIEENNTKVFADTTLHGLSGKKISFQNTSTFRYRDNNVNPETGKPIYSGVTREISSGIKLEVSGWVNGDGMVTSIVTASISRQGIDTSSSTGNPPPTTEKIVTTEVRGRSGEPVVLSGLVQKSESEQKKKTPFLSKIPLIGKLFSTEEKTEEHSQMIIYLVPHVEGYEQINFDNQFGEQWAENWRNRINQEEM